MIQTIIAIVIVVTVVYFAIDYVIKNLIKASKGESACNCCSAKDGCSRKDSQDGCK